MPVTPQSTRYRQITRALGRHGLGFLVSILGLDRFVPLHHGVLGYTRRVQPYSRPERVRLTLEDLGVTFIKLGQILSTRADLLPPAYQTELAKLQDEAPPLPEDVVRDVIAAELGRPVEEVFATFDARPLAAASIGQVHAATLPDGTEIVVKVQRPGVVDQINQDLKILENLAATARRRWALADQYDAVGLVNEFGQTLRAETDYIREGRNAERFHENFAGDEGVYFPRVYWETTTQKVLTLERVRGIKIDNFAALDAAGIDRPGVAQRGADTVLKMIFRDGFYHADPHPGNFFIEPSGRINVVDFGMVGTVDERSREQLVWALIAFAGDDPKRQVDTLFDLGVAKTRVDRASLQRDVEHLRARYYGRPVGEIEIRPVLRDVLSFVRTHRLQLPAGFAVLVKTVVMHENLVTQLDPSFDFTAVLVPYAQRLMMRHYSPLAWARWAGQAAVDAARLATELPQQARRLVAALERGDLELAVRPSGFDPVLRRIERIANRVVLGIVAASFVIALAVLLAAYHVRPEQGVVSILLLGFVGAVALGAYVAWSILRSGRP